MSVIASLPEDWRDLLREIEGLSDASDWSRRCEAVVLKAYNAGLPLAEWSGVGFDPAPSSSSRNDVPQLSFGRRNGPQQVVVTPSRLVGRAGHG